METITGGTAARTLTRHYADSGDNPAWVVETAGSASTTIRYVSGLSGDLAATVTTGSNAGTALTVVDPHGDTPTTITVPETGNATGIGAWVDTDEYGNPTLAAGAIKARADAGCFRCARFGTRLTKNSAWAVAGAGVGAGVTKTYRSVYRNPVLQAKAFPKKLPSPGSHKSRYYSPSYYAARAKIGFAFAGVAAIGTCVVASAGYSAIQITATRKR